MHSTIIVVLLKTAVLWAIWSLTYFSLKSKIGVDSSYEHRSQLAKAFFLCNVWCWSWALKTHRGPKTIFLSFQEIWVQTEVLKNKTYLRLVVATFWCFFRIWVACYWEGKLINPDIQTKIHFIHFTEFYVFLQKKRVLQNNA